MELEEQVEPASAPVEDTEAVPLASVTDVDRPHAEEDAAPAKSDGDEGGHAIGDFEPYGQ